MKILHLTNNYPTHNFPISGIFVKEQIDSLKNKEIKTEVYLINGREKGKKEYLKHTYLLRKYLKEKKYDVIHCHHALSALTLILSGQAKRNRVIVSFQNDPANEFGLKLFSFIQKKTDAWIFKNNSALITTPNHHYLPNGVNTGLFQPIGRDIACKKLGLDPDKQYILFVSSNFMRQQKRYDLFLKVIEILRVKYNLGNIEELKLINVERALVPYYFNAASVHLMTSDFEGSPNSVKEAMACNIPVVSTNVGNVGDLLADVNGSFVSSSNEPEKMAELVYKALTCSPNNGREMLIKKELDINSVAQKLKSIYQSLMINA